jgi:hypothetical protein
MHAMEWSVTTAPSRLAGPVPLQQHPRYAAACTALGRSVLWLRLGPQDAPLAHALVLSRHWPGLGRAALVSRGPVWLPELTPAARSGALHALVRGLRRTHAAVIATPDRVHGVDPLDQCGLLDLVTPMTVAQLELSGDAAAQRARLHGKWRNRLVRAEAADVCVDITQMPPDPDHWLLREEAAQARARRYRRLPPAFAAAWAAQGPGAAALLVAHQRLVPVAGMLFLRHGNAASYHVGWTGRRGRALCAHNLLMWRAMDYLAETGTTRLDLDLIDTQTAPSLARFKLGTGAVAVTLGTTRISAPGTALVARIAARLPPPAPEPAARAGGGPVTR